MANTGAVYAGSGSNVTGAGTIAWSNPGNIVSDNGSFATLAFGSGSGAQSNYLTSANHNFSSIPDGSTIDGIEWEIQVDADVSNRARDTDAFLTKNGSTPVGTDQSTNTNFTTTEVVRTYGGPTNLHGTTWTAAEVKAPTFGAMFRLVQALGSVDVTVDYIRITVYFTPPVTNYAAGSFFAFF